MIVSAFLMMTSCTDSTDEVTINESTEVVDIQELPIRTGKRPATTDGIPHVQLDLDIVPDVHDEMVRRVFSVPGIINEPSVILSWEGLWVDPIIDIVNPQALISGREFGHIHDDGSLHIFLEPGRAAEAIAAGWAIEHPFAAQGREGWEGFVMLYTPQTIEELNVVFQLIVEAYNYVTGHQLEATDFY